MKLKQKIRKVIFPILISLTALVVGVSIGANLGSQVNETNQAVKNNSKTDSVQARIKRYMATGSGVVLPSSGIKVNQDADASSSLVATDGTDLSGYVGMDIAKIDLKNVFSNGGTDSNDGTIWHQETKPNTGIIVLNTNVTNADKTLKANAYDYVNLKYVQYNKNTGVVIDLLSAPPPGLFTNNPTTWPSWKSDGSNTLADFFPTQSIRNAIASTFGFIDDETFSETQWFAKLNAKAFTLNLNALSLISVAELFNPNLVWGFGIYDLNTPILQSLLGFKYWSERNEILYNGLYKIEANNNVLDYFPNPQFQNMPALRYIEASNNKIKAIGDFNTYATGDLDATKSNLSDKKQSYFLYLESLWENDKYKNDPAVMAIKKWLTDTLPALYFKDTPSKARGSIHNQRTFQFAISINDVFLPDKNGDVLKKADIAVPERSTITIPDDNGNFGALNFASVVLNVSKSIHEINFSINEIERFPVSETRFTYVNFSNNRLKYVPPVALQPLPWNYFAATIRFFRTDPRDTFGTARIDPALTVDQWSKSYKDENNADDLDQQYKDTGARVVTQNLLAPALHFSNNQILDWWPNNTKPAGTANDGWYTWPNTVTSEDKDPPVAKSIASTHAEVPDPYNRKVDKDFFSSTDFYNAYLHRNFVTKGSFGNRFNPTTVENYNPYNNSAGNLLGDWFTSGYFTSTTTADFYRYYFANLDDNMKLFSQQNFNATLNFNLFSSDASKQKPFVLPGYITNGKSLTSVSTFNTGKTAGSSATNQTTDRYYDNFVPYVLGRTLPQNWTTSNSWSTKHLKVELLKNDGSNLLPNFANLSWKTVFENLSNSNFSNADYETNFIKQVIGALPYFDGIGSKGISGDDSNLAQGLDRNLFENQSQLILKISEPTMGLNYSYNINVLRNLDYTASALNPFTEGADSGNAKIENIGASTFSRKNNFAIPGQLNAGNLSDELTSWLNASDYIRLYLASHPEALRITSYNMEKGEVTVRFNINDANGKPVDVVGLDNNSLRIKGFNRLGYSFVDDEGNAIAVNDNAKLDELTDHFLPNDQTAVETWVKNHFQVNWLGLDLNAGGTTAPSDANPKGYYKLSELKNNYVQNLNFDANSGSLSFAVIIPAFSSNSNIPLSFSKSLTSFWQFGMTIDTSSYDPTARKSFADYTENLPLLKPFVKLTPTRILNDGSTQTKTAIAWSDEKSSAYIPDNTNLTLGINQASSRPSEGVLNFSASLHTKTTDGTTGALISIRSGTLLNLYNFSSQFSLQGDQTIGLARVRYIIDATKSRFTTKQLLATLTGYVNDQSNFRKWIEPLINYNKSAQTYDPATKTWVFSELSTEQKAQLVYGFNSTVSLSANDIEKNVTANETANTLTINNLYVKGGYLNGNFVSGTAVNAPVNQLANATYSFFAQTTQTSDLSSYTSSSPVATSIWNGPTYQGANAYFQSALAEWKNLSPSQWVARLVALKNANRTNLVNNKTYEVGNYETLFSFLNHVLNTSTSNNTFQTRVDISDVSRIEVNDFAGLVTIPADTLLIYNNYTNTTKSDPDARVSQPKKYGQKIEFELSDYKKFITDPEIKAALPWKLNAAVNNQFQAVEASEVMHNLNELLANAKKLYEHKATTNQELTAAVTAIQILANNFIASEYYNQPAVSKFFTQKFSSDDLGPTGVGEQYTEFSNISFENIDQVNGTMTIKISLKNYVSGYDSTNKRYTVENKLDHAFTLTNLVRHFVTPVWSSSGQTVTSQLRNLAQIAPELNLFEPNTDTPIFSYQDLSKPAFSNLTAKQYYEQLINNQTDLLDGQYIKLGSDGLNFAKWSVVDNYGTSQGSVSAEELNNLLSKLNGAEIVVKKSDIHFSEQVNQVYLLNPVIHFQGTFPTLAEKNAVMFSVFDPLKNSENYVPFGNDNNFKSLSLSNITLTGFSKVPTAVRLKDMADTINLGDQTLQLNQVLPSQIYEWIQDNYSNSTALYKLFKSFYQLSGTSDLNHPLGVVLNPEMAVVLRETNGLGNVSQWITYNDGLGTMSFNNMFFIINSFQNKEQTQPTMTALGVDKVTSGTQIHLSLANLKKSSSSLVTANAEVQNQISNSINDAVDQLGKDNFALAKQLLLFNGVKTNLLDNQSSLQVTSVSPNLEANEIAIHYLVRNGYSNGERKNMAGVYVLNNFYNPIQVFLKFGLTPLLLIITIIFLSIAYIHWKYRRHTNIKKFTKKKIRH